MDDREASLNPDPNVLPGCCCPLKFCAMTGHPPWIDRMSDRFFEVSLDTTFRRLVDAYRERERLSARGFGRLALGDHRFVSCRFERGSAVRLDTADRVLAFMGEPPWRPLFQSELTAYMDITGTKASVLGKLSVGDASFVTRLFAGRSPLLTTVDRVRRWMGKHSKAAERRAIGAETLHATWARRGPDALRGDGTMSNEERYLTTREAALVLAMSVRTLDRYRVTGEGPPFMKLGRRVRYLRSDIDRWAQARKRLSTSDDGRERRRRKR